MIMITITLTINHNCNRPRSASTHKETLSSSIEILKILRTLLNS